MKPDQSEGRKFLGGQCQHWTTASYLCCGRCPCVTDIKWNNSLLNWDCNTWGGVCNHNTLPLPSSCAFTTSSRQKTQSITPVTSIAQPHTDPSLCVCKHSKTVTFSLLSIDGHWILQLTSFKIFAHLVSSPKHLRMMPLSSSSINEEYIIIFSGQQVWTVALMHCAFRI